MFLFTNIVIYAILVQVVHALPLDERIVIAPHITSPNADTVWTPGSDELVTWDTSIIPPNGNFTGTLFLGFQTAGSENLDVAHPLADGFSLRDGSVHVTCPTVSAGNNYIVVLMGDSGNTSPQFTVASTSNSSVPSASSTLPTSPLPASTASSSSSLMNPAPASNPPAPTSTFYVTPLAVTSPAVHTTSSTPLGGTVGPSASAASISPAAVPKGNNAIPRTLNAGVMLACAVVTGVTIFS
ncbi:hypothetical protein F5148DRAFT_624021 [Russula earlei]|uniref:Uncharacterized protein n=1 Tax=Russula earlei TaxID=71964 RepID=A0ACC0TVK8_9AGAM|nr:hypothetical protein F5148DRAFT_624021 [Russula earlei]